jgi:hypothetical protein
VGNWAAVSVSRDRAFRLWLRQLPPATPARFYSDGVCEVDVRCDARALAATLAELGSAHRQRDDPPLTAADIERAAAGWPTFWGLGRALVTERETGEKPPGWEDVSFEGIQIARRAATADALHALMDELGRMKVTNALRLHQFLDASSAVRDAVHAALERTATVSVTLAPDQVAVAEAAIAIPDLIRILTETYQAHYRGEEFQVSDFREMALIAAQGRLAATGLAPPPADSLMKSPYRDIDLDAPPWVSTTLAVVGRFAPDADQTLDEAAQVDAARLAGIDLLRIEIERLPVLRDVSVERLLEFRPGLKDDVVLFITSARESGPPRRGPDGVGLALELPLPRLWEILAAGLETIEVDELAAPASQPATASAPTKSTAPATSPADEPASQPTTRPASGPALP